MAPQEAAAAAAVIQQNSLTLTLTFNISTENWHTGQSCAGECSHQFRFSTLFVSELRARMGQTDRRTGKARTVAY